MGQANKKLNWKQIVEKYPDEWVLLEDYEPDIDFDGKGIIAQKGKILVHSKDKKEFYKRSKELNAPDSAIRYTGEIVPAGFKGLWQLR